MQEGEKVREEEGRGGVRIRVSKSVPGYAPAAVSHALAGGVSGAAGTGKSKATRLRVTQSSSHFVTNRKHFTFFFFSPLSGLTTATGQRQCFCCCCSRCIWNSALVQ